MTPGTAVVPISTTVAVEPRTVCRSAEDVAVAFLLGYGERTRRAYGADLNLYFSWCRAHGVDPLAATRAHVDAYARQLAEGDHLAPSTVARRLSALAGFYKYALSEELVARSPMTHVRRPKVGSESQSTGLDKDEVVALLAAAEEDGPRTSALVLLLALNGLRVSEALGAKVTDLDAERGHRVLRIVRKGGKSQTVPLAPRVAEAIDHLLAGRTEGPIFATSTGKALDRPAVWRTLRRLAATAVPAKAGSLHPHDLRHAFVTLSLDAGASLRDVQDAAGHADPRTTRRYDRARHNLDRHPTYALAGLVG
jgi:integrase/recombinase XerD